MSPVYTLDRTALLKVLLHSIKYPSASVNGILLADKKSNNQAVTVVDTIPVLHSFLTLAPVLETALIQVRVSTLLLQADVALLSSHSCAYANADRCICKGARTANCRLISCK